MAMTPQLLDRISALLTALEQQGQEVVGFITIERPSKMRICWGVDDDRVVHLWMESLRQVCARPQQIEVVDPDDLNGAPV